MAMVVVVGWLGVAAMGRVRAWDADGLHQTLQGIAPVVAACGNATYMALASWCKLVTA